MQADVSTPEVNEPKDTQHENASKNEHVIEGVNV